jgi:cyclopropane-fatty-acyl-phospholipid synthase
MTTLQPAPALDHTSAAKYTNSHYDLPPEVFGIVLGQRVKYSCGLYTRSSLTLDEAQENKLHYIAGKIKTRPGNRILDVGCGWGSAVLYFAAEQHCDVTGVTVSRVQRDHILTKAEKLGVIDRVTVIVDPILDADLGTEPYDAATFVGTLIHMVDKPAILRKTYQALRQDGRLYVGDSYWRNKAARSAFADSEGYRFSAHDYYGFGAPELFSEFVEAVESAGFSIADVRDFTHDYLLTLTEWERRAGLHRAELEQLSPGFADAIARMSRTAHTGFGYSMKQYALTAIKNRFGVCEIEP